MNNQEAIKEQFAHKYFATGIDGDRLKSDKSQSENKAKKCATDIKKLYYKIRNEADCKLLEKNLIKIKELLNKIIQCADSSNSEVTIDSLKKSKNMFKDISDKLINAHIFKTYNLCKMIMKKDISKENIIILKEKLQLLIGKVNKLQDDVKSFGDLLSEETSMKIIHIKEAHQKTIEYVDARETDREIERWLDETPMDERAMKADMVASIHESGHVSPMTKENIDVPIYKNSVDVADPEF